MFNGVGNVKDIFEQKCSGCGHVEVCAVFRAIGPLLSKGWEDDNRPFDPEDLATICKAFVSAKTIEMIMAAQ